MTTAADLQLDFEESFLADDFFSESIRYTPADTVLPRTVRAFVYRRGYRAQAQRYSQGSSSKTVEYAVEIRISSSNEKGILLPVRGDTVELPVNIGESASTLIVDAILDQDPGTWRLGLRA